MGINVNIEQFRENLLNSINECGLPIGVAYLIVKDIFTILEIEYKKVIQQEKNMQSESMVLEISTQDNDNVIATLSSVTGE